MSWGMASYRNTESLHQATLGTSDKEKKGSGILLLWVITIFLPRQGALGKLHRALSVPLQRGPRVTLEQECKDSPGSHPYMSVE